MPASFDPVRCMQLNERRQVRTIATLADEHLLVGAGALAFMAGTPWICKGVGADLDTPLDAEAVATISAWFRERGVAPIVECTSHSSAETFAALAQAGYVLLEVENVLARAVAAPPVDLPDGYAIERLDAEDDEAMRAHAELVGLGFHPEGVPEPVLESGIRSQRDPHARGYFVITDEGERVAASGMEITELDPGTGTAKLLALWGTTVVEAHRRKGLQRALIAHRLRVGAREGAELAVIESKPGIPTERNAARVGFQLAYARLVFRAPGP